MPVSNIPARDSNLPLPTSPESGGASPPRALPGPRRSRADIRAGGWVSQARVFVRSPPRGGKWFVSQVWVRSDRRWALVCGFIPAAPLRIGSISFSAGEHPPGTPSLSDERLSCLDVKPLASVTMCDVSERRGYCKELFLC